MKVFRGGRPRPNDRPPVRLPRGVVIELILFGCAPWTRASEVKPGAPCGVCGGSIRFPGTYCAGCTRAHPRDEARARAQVIPPLVDGGPTKYVPAEKPKPLNRRDRRYMAKLVALKRMQKRPEVQAWAKEQGLA